MYLKSESTVVSNCVQFACRNIPQVKNTINELTMTKSTTADWKALCASVKKGSSDSVDYSCFINGEERDCSVFVGYDTEEKCYLVWIELDPD